MPQVLNNSIEFFGARFITRTANILEPLNINFIEEKNKLFAEVFEQLMLFDKVFIKTGENNLSLYILIKEFGINQIEENIQNGNIQFLFWKPYLICEQGKFVDGPLIRKFDDTSKDIYDDTKILGTEPIIVSTIVIEQKGYDLEKSIDNILLRFQLHPDRKRIFKKIILNRYIIPTIKEAEKAKEFAIDSYNKNKLERIGLPYVNEPKMLNSVERKKLLDVAYDYFENLLLAENEIKKYNDYNFFEAYKNSIYDLAETLKISKDLATIFQIHNIPNLKDLVLKNEVKLHDVFKIRELQNAKYFRKWINEASETIDSKEISKEYLNEVKGDSKFFNRTGGKFLKTLGVLGIGTGIGASISGLEGSLMGTGLAAIIKDFGLSLIDSFWLDKILKGKAPSTYIDNIGNFLVNKNR